MTDLKSRADERLDAALAQADQQDPRPYFRGALRDLKDRDPDGLERAIRYFEDELVPAVAGEADPLDAWWAYGEMLARTLGPGRTVEVDAVGRARPLDGDPAPDAMVLHLPDDTAAAALVLRIPRDASAAQKATVELLVEGRQTASAYEG